MNRIMALPGRIIRSLKRRFRLLCNIPIRLDFPKFHILLPAVHHLAENLRIHPKYDRFLPHLARFISPNQVIVDIGANVGDSLAAMVAQNPHATYVCIEADQNFYGWLLNNIQHISAAYPHLSIHPVQALVGKSVSNASLEGKAGTRHAVPDQESGVSSQPLEQLVQCVAGRPVRLIKSDVDGFDYDVLDSALPVIRQQGPMLFFECEYAFAAQKSGYQTIMQQLHDLGYHEWVLFDNFGELMLRTHDLHMVFQLMEYVWKLNLGQSTRTIHYFDILTVQAQDSALLDQILAGYSP